jgi:hypothetical protein
MGWTQPLTEMTTRNFPGGKGDRRVSLTNSPPPQIDTRLNNDECDINDHLLIFDH